MRSPPRAGARPAPFPDADGVATDQARELRRRHALRWWNAVAVMRIGSNPRIQWSKSGAYPTRSDAELAQTVLAAAGIASSVVADDAGGAYPFDLSGAARLLVDYVARVSGDGPDVAPVLNSSLHEELTRKRD
jgi:hypothetical protein